MRRSGQKRYSPKVRTGCTTCKLRRVKCGEEKPACLKCRQKGRSCMYHPQPIRVVNLDVQHYSSTTPPLPVSSRYGNSEQVRCFEFYIRRTAPMVSFAGPAKDYWTILVPQASWKYTEVKHMLVALSLLDQYLTGETTTLRVETEYRRALEYYNMAVSGLLSKSPALACVIIFSMMAHTFEGITKGMTLTSIHTEAASKTIREHIARQSCQSNTETILINQIHESIGREPLQYGMGTGLTRQTSENLQSMQQAREQLQSIVTSASQTVMLSATELQIAKGNLNSWRYDFEQYRYSGPEPLCQKRGLYLASNIVGSYLQLRGTQNADQSSQRLHHHLLKDAEYVAEHEDITELKWSLKHLLIELVRKTSHDIDLNRRALMLITRLGNVVQ